MNTGSVTLDDVLDVLLFRAGYNTTAVVAGVSLLGYAAGMVGVFALLRKRALVSDAVSHATLPGVGLAFLVASALGMQGRSMPVLLLGALATGALGVLSIHAIIRHSRLRDDAAIAITLSVFFGVGIVLLSIIQRTHPGSAGGLNTFVFGHAATMRAGDAWLMAAISGVAVLAALLLFKEFSLVCFNSGFAQSLGWRVGLLDGAMMSLAVLVTVAGLQAVGVILVVALLIIPPVAARFWSDRLPWVVALSGVIGAASGYTGGVISALVPGQPAGAVIILAAGALFLVSLLCAPRHGVLASALRRLAFRLRIAGDHVLEAAAERAGRLDAGAYAEFHATRGWVPGFSGVILASLRLRGLLRRDGGAIALTEAGVRQGSRIVRNHLLWEQYLIGYADVAPSHVDWSVDQVEHVLSDSLVAELERALAERGIAVPAGVGV